MLQGFLTKNIGYESKVPSSPFGIVLKKNSCSLHDVIRKVIDEVNRFSVLDIRSGNEKEFIFKKASYHHCFILLHFGGASFATIYFK